eukprot:TRINITY_DN40517_c0_g1_i4.p2 TRINITY_DN40517_c0_g1~~TRINITY_DN40517_c0_g1_i4.p2  ORF type:complete len:138 (+),score=13.21 TRINITY_DN40517_c0_g1_i4:24-437(+)
MTLKLQVSKQRVQCKMDLVWNGILRMSVLDHYWCEVCQRPCCGIEVSRQHYQGDFHRKKLRNFQHRNGLPENVHEALDKLESLGGPRLERNPQVVPPRMNEFFCRVCGVLRFQQPPQVCEAHMERMEQLSNSLPQRK